MFPGSRIIELEPLEPDTGATASSSQKAAGYGEPTRVALIDGAGQRRELVWRTASRNEFGHDRRADRVANLVQAYEDFAATPHHVAAVDVGSVTQDGSLQSLHNTDEPYLITSFAPG